MGILEAAQRAAARRMVERSWGVIGCAIYLGWASLAMWTLVVVLLTSSRTQTPMRYSLPVFAALHPAIALAAIPASFDIDREQALAAFAGFGVLTALAAVLLYQLKELGRKLARMMCLLGVAAGTTIAYVQSIGDLLVVVAVTAPYLWTFFYLGRDYVQLRFQMAKPGKPPAPKMFRPSN